MKKNLRIYITELSGIATSFRITSVCVCLYTCVYTYMCVHIQGQTIKFANLLQQCC